MNSIIIQGGLGNQMFQIFMLIAFSSKYNKPFVIPRSMQSWDKRHSYWETFFCRLKPFLVDNEVIQTFSELKEPTFHYIELPNINGSICLNGYFQSYKYFESHYNEICEKIGLYQLRNNLRENCDTDFRGSISLHFRMGDYKNMPNHHPLISDNYYVDSLRHIIETTQKTVWNIFYCCEESDCQIVLSRIENIRSKFDCSLNFIKIDGQLNDYEQMLFMSCCEHNIIANSSFSWWSAYINNNSQKVVCYPSLWFGLAYEHFNTIDMFPAFWRKININ